MSNKPTMSAENWRPIESAPKDGKTPVIGWSKRHGMHIGVLANYKRPEMPLGYANKWFLPTHWQLLPEPPTSHE